MFALLLNFLRPEARQPSSQWMAVMVCCLGMAAAPAGAAPADATESDTTAPMPNGPTG